MKIQRYQPADEALWNGFLKETKNGTFLFHRQFMDYHADRFRDCSLLFYENGKLRALFPANWDEGARRVWSHQGLTYGGLLTAADVTTDEVLTMFQLLTTWCRETLGAVSLLYKPIPYIYSQYPSEEDLYALFRAGAVLRTRAVSSVVPLAAPLGMRTLRLRGAKKALQNDLYIDRMGDDDRQTLTAFWRILETVLKKYHNTRPVHTVQEMALLMARFPKEIKLFLVRHDKEIVAGCVVFVTGRVAHIQYIASSERGREWGALDLLFRHLITERYKGMDYLDFGISTENEGRVLNEGLIFQKEGFGGRAVCYDSYEVNLTDIREGDLSFSQV